MRWSTNLREKPLASCAVSRGVSTRARYSDRIELIARQLCRAAGKGPDKTVPFGTRLTLDVDGCKVTGVAMLPA